MRGCVRKLLGAMALMIVAGCQSGTQAPSRADVARDGSESPVIFKFATVGDSRAEPSSPANTAQDEIWLQATGIWSRMSHEIEQQKPQVLVFNGDMIYGYDADAAGVDKQYAFWRGMMAGMMERGTYVLPVPGNHEVQDRVTKAGGGTTKKATVMRENVWRANMGDLILNQPLWRKTTGVPAAAWQIANTPAIGSDGVMSDQRQLSYSFDAGSVHLVVINTDPAGFDASAPVTWLKRDMADAKSRGAKQFFVFGHKMPFTYFPPGKISQKPDGFDERLDIRDAFWEVIEQYGATYFCGHQHVYNASQPTRASGGKAWQVIVGTGGSPLSIKPGQSAGVNDRMYAWAEISVRQSGRVTMLVRGFDESLAQTRVIEQLDISNY
jgi:hypothetical protein